MVDGVDLEFEHELDYVVAKGILDESECVLTNAGCQSFFLERISSVNTLLHDAAAVLVTCNFYTLVYHGIVQELIVLRWPALEDLLNDMVAIDIFTHFFDSVFEVVTQHLKVNLFRNDFNNLLNRSSSMCVFAQLYWLSTHFIDDHGELVLVTLFAQFLNQIVTETVIHKVPCVRKCVREYLVEKFLIIGFFTLLNILLQKSTASLIFC